jgi:16S rRNA C967 or C1407 C5-methylase (RsmB/RsmF family)
MSENQKNNSQVLPELFVQRLMRELGPNITARALLGMRGKRFTTFRHNKLTKGETDPLVILEQEGIQIHSVPSVEGAWWVADDFRERLLQSKPYSEKRIYVQNLASMLPPLILDIKPGQRILDLTAAPGSKTLQLAEMAGPDAEVAAVEIVRSRFFRLKANLESHGADFVRVFLQDGTKVWRYRPAYFDRVLLDAPCSSEGRFLCAEPDSYAYWSPKKGREMARKQKALLHSAIHSVKPGGLIAYSTCSLSVEENESIISRALVKYDGIIRARPIQISLEEAVPAERSWKGKDFHSGLKHARRIVPSELTEGFFLCLLERIDPLAD